MKKKNKNKKALSKNLLNIDKVTTTNLDIILGICGIHLSKDLIDKIIDMVELIETKGDNVSIKDIIKLKSEWSNHQKMQ